MQRYRVVAFETVFPIWEDQVQPRGGGVAFIPLDSVEWPAIVTAIVERHFRHHTFRSAEIGIATLDELALPHYCHRFADTYWQGGDTL